jgi:hypothetical protein
MNHRLALLLSSLLAACGTTDSSKFPDDLPRSPRPAWKYQDEASLHARITQLIPAQVKDRDGWATDLQNAYRHLKIQPSAEAFCASIAIIEQESSFQANPMVPNLPAIVHKELDQRAEKYGIPKVVINTAMLKSSPDGRNYRERIDQLKTEKELNELFQDMIAEIPFGQRWLADYNPVRTAGSMQVSVKFAEQHAAEHNYPYPLSGSLRDEVFTRRGGIYFGSAILLDYPAPYTDVIYRFADFNAGRYASRNAAFQNILATLSGSRIMADGDLLRYKDGKPVDAPSEVESALRKLAGALHMSHADIRRDLLREKQAEFRETSLYQRLFLLADKAAGTAQPRQAMPKIDLKSPKITRQITTEWFARRVDGRYRACLARDA